MKSIFEVLEESLQSFAYKIDNGDPDFWTKEGKVILGPFSYEKGASLEIEPYRFEESEDKSVISPLVGFNGFFPSRLSTPAENVNYLEEDITSAVDYITDFIRGSQDSLVLDVPENLDRVEMDSYLGIDDNGFILFNYKDGEEMLPTRIRPELLDVMFPHAGIVSKFIKDQSEEY